MVCFGFWMFLRQVIKGPGGLFICPFACVAHADATYTNTLSLFKVNEV